MVETRLLKYVEDALVKGYDDEAIEAHLVKSGWKKYDVKAALATAHLAPGFEDKIKQIRSGKSNEEVNVPELGFFQKIKYILFKPKVFFENIFDESDIKKGIEKPFLFYLALTTFSTILFMIFYIFEQSSDIYFKLDMIRVAGAVLISVLAAIIFLFIMSGAVYLVARLLKSKQGYNRTFTAIAYAYTPVLIFGAIPYIGFIFIPWAIILEFYSLSKANEFSIWRAIIAFIAPIILFLLLIFVIYLFIRSFTPSLVV